MPRPAVQVVFRLPQIAFEMDQYSQVLNRVDLACNDKGHAAHSRPIHRISWKQWRLWITFLQVFYYGQGLGQNLPAVVKRRHEPLRVNRFVRGSKLLAAGPP